MVMMISINHGYDDEDDDDGEDANDNMPRVTINVTI